MQLKSGWWGRGQDEKRENKEVFWPVFKLNENNTRWVLTGKSPIHNYYCHFLRPKSFFALSDWIVTGMTTVTSNSKPVSWLYVTKLFHSPSCKSTIKLG